MRKKFKVELKKHPKSGRYAASAVELPGCFAEGATRKEALENIQEAIKDFTGSLAKGGKRVELYELDNRKSPFVEVTLGTAIKFHDPKTLRWEEVQAKQELKQRQHKQRSSGYTGKLPATMSGGEIIGVLKRAGFHDAGGTGHAVMKRDSDNIVTTVPRHDVVTDYTLTRILAQTRLTIPEFNALKNGYTFEQLRTLGRR